MEFSPDHSSRSGRQSGTCWPEESGYTKSLKENPNQYRKELELYKKAGTVWISYGVPFLIPITAGFLTALVLGDFFMALLSLFMP